MAKPGHGRPKEQWATRIGVILAVAGSAVGRSKFAMYFGAIGLLMPLVVYMYYVLIESWCLGYAISYLTGDLALDAGGEIDEFVENVKANAPTALSDSEVNSTAFGQFFSNYVGLESDGQVLQNNMLGLSCFVGVFAFNFLLIYRGISKASKHFAGTRCL